MLVDRRRDFNHENVIEMPSRDENDAHRSPHRVHLMARIAVRATARFLLSWTA